MTETSDISPDAGTAESPDSELSALELARQQTAETWERYPWLKDLQVLIRFGLLAAAGAVLRLAYAPSLLIAGTAWAVLAVVLGWWLWVRKPLPEPSGWRPGDSFPRDIPAATMEAVAPLLEAAPFPVWLGEVARCPGPGKHYLCRTACAEPVRGGVQVIIGEHMAGRSPSQTAFVVGHELLHPAGWRRRLWVVSTYLRMAGWLVAGWALPWPQALAGIAAVQAAYTVSGWALEIACDLGSARVTGAEAALASHAAYREDMRKPDPRPPWLRRVGYVVVKITAYAPHPPLKVRCAMIRVLVRT